MNSHAKTIIKIISENGRRHGNWRAFSDFVEMGAIAISNRCDFPKYDKREERYFEIIKAYTKDEMFLFSEALGALALALETPDDILGKVFHELELHNKYVGQFFTPYELCRMMASITIASDVQEKIQHKGYFTASEPACGSGAMVIALADGLKDAGIDYTQALHVTAVDVDAKCVHMAYLQLSLLGIPAYIIHGNTLTLEEWDIWATPAHIIDGWARKMVCVKTSKPAENNEIPLRINQNRDLRLNEQLTFL